MDATIFEQRVAYRLGAVEMSANGIGSYMASTIWAKMSNANPDVAKTWALREAMTWSR